MRRLILKKLAHWKNQKYRKPLIIKGVRQTGKTYTLKHFGKNDFPAFHYVNFEQNQKAANIFNSDFDTKRILDELSFLLSSTIDEKQDLLIFDEIQACPNALTSLKYFAEERPELALCCAGSLLGLHLGESSFPVGKVDFLHMRPMCFAEFLEACGDEQSLSILNNCKQNSSIAEVVHEHLWQQFKIYLVTGGLPEVVKTYIDNKHDLYSALELARNKQKDLIFGYYADIAKHAGKVNAMHIDRVWSSVPAQLGHSQDGSAKRFQFKGIVPGIDRYQRLASVIDWLQAAELIIKVPIIDHIKLPLSSCVKASLFKLYSFDVGILGALSDLPAKSILEYEFGTYKGYYAENFVAQEFLAENKQSALFCWEDNRAEIEFLYPIDSKIIPIEVKSGWVTRNQSLNKYAEKYHPPYRTTFSSKPLHIDLKNHFHHYPLYMAFWFPL